MDNFLPSFGRTMGVLSDASLVQAYVVCMFVVAAFRPRSILKSSAFRFSFVVLALYLIVPAIADFVVSLVNQGKPAAFPGMGAAALPGVDAASLPGMGAATFPRVGAAAPSWTETVNISTALVAKCLLALAICCGLASLGARPAQTPGDPSPSAR